MLSFRGKSGRMGEWEREEEDKVKMKCGKWMGLWVTNYFKHWGLFQMSTVHLTSCVLNLVFLAN